MWPLLKRFMGPYGSIMQGETLNDMGSVSDLKALTDALAAEKAKHQAATAGSFGPQQPAPTPMAAPSPNNWGLSGPTASPPSTSWADSLSAPTSNGQPVTGPDLISKMMSILHNKADD